jgi:tetratricopeptide (TPR) repeat protein
LADIVERFSIFARQVTLALAALTAGILAYFSIRNALAAHYLGLDTRDGIEKAIRLEPSNAQNWHSLGRSWQLDMENPDLDRAVSAYRKALELDPRSASIWLDLASAYESQNDSNAARTAYLQARRFYPASAEVSWRFGNFQLRRNEQTEGFLAIHHAIEADPTRGLEAFLVCRHFEPDFDVILDRVVPPVVSVYSDIMTQLIYEGRPDQALKVWPRLVALHPKLQSGLVLFFVDSLLSRKQESEAEKVWAQAVTLMDLPKLEDAPGSLIWDGGFETDVTGGGLAWRIQQGPNVVIGPDLRVWHSGKRALRIDFGARQDSDFAGVCQRVVVEPNTTYELSAWLRTGKMAQGSGMFLHIAEQGIPWKQFARTPEVTGTNEWTKVSTPWVSPDHSQLAEVCLSRLAGLEFNKEPVTAWIDDVSLRKLE